MQCQNLEWHKENWQNLEWQKQKKSFYDMYVVIPSVVSCERRFTLFGPKGMHSGVVIVGERSRNSKIFLRNT